MPRWKKIPQFTPQPWLSDSNSEETELGTRTTTTSTSTPYPSSTSSINNTYSISDISEVNEAIAPSFDDICPPDELEELSKEWLLVEIKHKVSKIASNKFWSLALKHFNSILQNRSNKIPQFQQQRRKLFKTYVPPISLNAAYSNNENDEITEVTDVSTLPISRFPRDTYTKLYESATVKVSLLH